MIEKVSHDDSAISVKKHVRHVSLDDFLSHLIIPPVQIFKKVATLELLAAGKRADKERPEPIFANKVNVFTVLKSAIKSGWK